MVRKVRDTSADSTVMNTLRDIVASCEKNYSFAKLSQVLSHSCHYLLATCSPNASPWLQMQLAQCLRVLEDRASWAIANGSMSDPNVVKAMDLRENGGPHCGHTIGSLA